MTDYKAIVLDLDGTLTNDKKEITPRTREALLAAQDRGVVVILASGRPTYGITAVADELDLGNYGGYVMAYNGGKVRQWGTRRVVEEHVLDPDLVPVLHKAAKDAGFEILTYQGEGIAATAVDNKYVQTEAFINKLPVTLYEDFPAQVFHPINKCLIVGDPKPLAELETKLAAQLKGRAEIYRSAGYFLECVPVGVEKSATLKRLLDTLGISLAETIACGDGYNDVDMIRAAGLGVAMSNAAREAQDVADYITWSNNEDGIAHVVEKFILK